MLLWKGQICIVIYSVGGALCDIDPAVDSNSRANASKLKLVVHYWVYN